MTSEKMKETIILYRKAQGLSQKALADKCNLTQSTISTLENSSFYPSMYSFLTICEGLSITPSQFFLEDGEENIALTEDSKNLLDLWNSFSPQNKELALQILNCIKDSQPQID